MTMVDQVAALVAASIAAGAVLAVIGVYPRIVAVRRRQLVVRNLARTAGSSLRPDLFPSASGLLARILKNTSVGRLFSKVVEGAALESSQSFLMVVSAITIVTAIAGTVLSASGWVGLALLGASPVVVLGYLRRRARRRFMVLRRQLPVALRVLASGLAVGLSLEDALSRACRECSEPIAGYLTNVSDRVDLGLPTDQALTDFGVHIGSEDFDDLSVLLAVHRRTGGDLAAVLDQAASRVEKRLELLRDLEAKTAQARFSGWVVGLLPVGFVGLLAVVDPEYLRPLFNSPGGLLVLIISALADAAGLLIIRAMVKVDGIWDS